MGARRSPLRVFAVLALFVGLAACGDDDAGDDAPVGATEPADDADDDTTTTVEATGDPNDPCTLLVEDDFTAALDASVSEPTDVTGNFGFGGSPSADARPQACQWQATTTGASGVSSFSVEVITVVGPASTEAYDAELEFAEARSISIESVELPGDRGVALVDDGEPEIIAQAGEVAVKLSTASDDLPTEELEDLADRALRRAGIV